MSAQCPKCQNITYDEGVCDKCGYKIDNEKKSKYKNEDHCNYDLSIFIIAISLAIIAITGVYFAYNVYKQNELAHELSKEIKRTMPNN